MSHSSSFSIDSGIGLLSPVTHNPKLPLDPLVLDHALNSLSLKGMCSIGYRSRDESLQRPLLSRSAPNSVSHIDPEFLAHNSEPPPPLSEASSSHSSDQESELSTPSTPVNRPARPVSCGSSWEVVTLGRGKEWKRGFQPTGVDDGLVSRAVDNAVSSLYVTNSSNNTTTQSQYDRDYYKVSTPDEDPDWGLPPHLRRIKSLEDSSTSTSNMLPAAVDTTPLLPSSSIPIGQIMLSPICTTPTVASEGMPPTSPRPSSARPGYPSLRRRSSGKRVSLIGGQVSMFPIEPPSPPPVTVRRNSLKAPRLPRYGSTSSFTSVQSANPPSAFDGYPTSLGGKMIEDFEVEDEIGRGAYGLVKRACEILDDGSLGPTVIIKQVIKSRILADCWKKHPKFGTIPIEIYVMSAISSATYTLPPPRPWDNSRFGGPSTWIEGETVQGHPNICPLIDFFEDQHYYYLILPYTIPELPPVIGEPDEPPPKDMFDLVEAYPQGLPPDLVRTYLGQIADGLSFLHQKGIVHRDIKDENVVLGPNPGQCILIDFGSSGVIRKNGWDTFSGTLDYAGPEILRGERYFGKEQDVWAFGVVAYVLLVGECPFVTPAEAQEGLSSILSKASTALDERCGGEHATEGEEIDGGGALGDAMALVKACLEVRVEDRPTFERILESRFLAGSGGWGMKR